MKIKIFDEEKGNLFVEIGVLDNLICPCKSDLFLEIIRLEIYTEIHTKIPKLKILFEYE